MDETRNETPETAAQAPAPAASETPAAPEPEASAAPAPTPEGEAAVALAGEEPGEPEEPEIDPTGRVVDPGARRYHWGTGRRKTAVARVRVRLGSGQLVINGRGLRDFFPRQVDRDAVLGPLRTLKVEDKVDVLVNVRGGGITGQAGAIRMGLGRALASLYPDAHDVLRDAGHLTRDPRMVERKKYGLRGARRAFQWVKR